MFPRYCYIYMYSDYHHVRLFPQSVLIIFTFNLNSVSRQSDMYILCITFWFIKKMLVRTSVLIDWAVLPLRTHIFFGTKNVFTNKFVFTKAQEFKTIIVPNSNCLYLYSIIFLILIHFTVRFSRNQWL